MVLLIGLVAAGALSWLCYFANDRNETRLLKLQAKEAGTLVQVIIPAVETPLASAAEIAATNGGDATQFRAYIAPYVGGTGPFVSASLWQLGGSTPRMVAAVGAAPELTATPGKAETFLSTGPPTPALRVIGPIREPQPRLGYAYVSGSPSPSYAVYVETALTPDQRGKAAKGSAFSELRFAIYLGDAPSPDTLLGTNADQVPITGRTATVVVPFGSNSLTLVAAPADHLGGTLLAWLWWIVAAVGGVLAIVGALIAERLVRRRRGAEQLTSEVQHLLGEQRSIAEALQHALLPQTMPAIEGVQIGARFVPGVNGVEIGGDWYDVIALDEHRFFFVIGDVSGRGVAAGAVMASLHFAIRGFVSEGHSPTKILDTLRGLLSVSTDGHFATVLCGIADVDRREITIANAGHLPALLIDDHQVDFMLAPVSPPIGVTTTQAAESATFAVPAGATVLLYTDGLVERRGENIHTALDRLRTCATGHAGSVDALLAQLFSQLGHDEAEDDTAVLAVQWQALTSAPPQPVGLIGGRALP